jgi:hypothetical protein
MKSGTKTPQQRPPYLSDALSSVIKIFEVLRPVIMKSTNFVVVMPFSSERTQRCGGKYHLHLQGTRVSQERDHQKQVASCANAGGESGLI